MHTLDVESHPDWHLEEVWETCFEFADTIEKATMTALTDLCEKNKLEIGSSPAKYYPVKNQDDGTWKRRIKALKNSSRVEHNVVAAVSADYMTSMYNLHQACQYEY